MLRVVCCTICMYKNKHVLETKRILRGVLWYATVQDPVYHSEMYLVVPLSIPKKTQAWMLRPPKKSRPQMLNARDACQCVITVQHRTTTYCTSSYRADSLMAMGNFDETAL